MVGLERCAKSVTHAQLEVSQRFGGVLQKVVESMLSDEAKDLIDQLLLDDVERFGVCGTA
jgi:hypothetical protein